MSDSDAQAPAKPLRIVVPFTPGGSTDLLARALAPHLGSALATSVMVDNKPGAGGSIGAAEVARSAPDGATLLMGHIGTLGVNPSIYPNLTYDPVKSFAPVAWVARVPNVLVVASSSPFTSLAQLLDAAKSRPDKISFSSGGNGSAAHIAFEALKLRAKVGGVHVPYKGTAPSITDVMGGQVDATFTGIPAVIQHIRSGRLRALAVSSSQRLAVLPEVPTVAELGYAGFEADQWYGLVAPYGTPPELIEKLNAIVNKALALPDVKQALSNEGAVPVVAKPSAFGEHIAREIPRWREVVRAGGVRVE